MLSDRLSEFFLEPRIRDFASCGRLDWVLGLADDAPEERIALSFSPVLSCLERHHERIEDDDPVRLIAARRLGTGNVIQSCGNNRLLSLSLGAFYNYGRSLLHPSWIDVLLAPYFPQAQHYSRHVMLEPSIGSLYIVGADHDLPERLRIAASMHAPLAEGLSFFAFETAGDCGKVTLLIPCSEILRSCYGQLGSYLDWYRVLGSAGPAAKGLYAPTGAPDHAELELLLPRAIAFGRPGMPRPILVRPTGLGPSVVSGFGYCCRDEIGEVICIVAELSIVPERVHELRGELAKRRIESQGYTAAFAPVFANGNVRLVELGAEAPLGTGDAIENYDIHAFDLQISALDDILTDPFPDIDFSILRDIRQWIPRHAAAFSVRHRSVALSASFVKEAK